MPKALEVNVPPETKVEYVALKRFTCLGHFLNPGDTVPSGLTPDKVAQLVRVKYIEPQMMQATAKIKKRAPAKATAKPAAKPEPVKKAAAAKPEAKPKAKIKLADLSRKELRQLCREKGVSPAGSADQLRAKLKSLI